MCASSLRSCLKCIYCCPHVCQAVQVHLPEWPLECKLTKRSKVWDCESNLFPSCSSFPTKVFEIFFTQFANRQKKSIFFMAHQKWYRCWSYSSRKCYDINIWSVDLVRFSIFASLVGEVASILSSCSDHKHICQQGPAVHRVYRLTFWAAAQLLGGLWLVELQQCCIFHLEKHSHCTLSSAPNTTERCVATDMVFVYRPKIDSKSDFLIPLPVYCTDKEQRRICAVRLGFLILIWRFCQLNVLIQGWQYQQCSETTKHCKCSSSNESSARELEEKAEFDESEKEPVGSCQIKDSFRSW